MFGWFKRKPKAAGAELVGTVKIEQAAEKAMVTVGATATAAPQPATELPPPTLQFMPKRPQPRAVEMPTVGMAAEHVIKKRKVPMKIVVVQAKGQRVVALADGADHRLAFTRRRDGSYRLSGAPDKSEARLVFGARTGVARMQETGRI